MRASIRKKTRRSPKVGLKLGQNRGRWTVDQHHSVSVRWSVRMQKAGWSLWHSEDCSRREVAMLSVELRHTQYYMNHNTLLGKSSWRQIRQIIVPTQSGHTPASISSLAFRSVSFVLNSNDLSAVNEIGSIRGELAWPTWEYYHITG